MGAQLKLFPTRSLPIFYRGQCSGQSKERMSGQVTCQHFTCRHNLIGELATLEPKRAHRVAIARLEGRIVASCALDVAEMGAIDDRENASYLGMGRDAFAEFVGEAEAKLQKEYEERNDED